MSRLDEVTAKIDGFFARVESRHGDDMQCTTGCSDCCHVRLSITGVEAAAIMAAAATWPVERRAGLRAVGPEDRCAALGPDGRCRIYEVRPVVCRSHGVPIRMRRPGLPVIQDQPQPTDEIVACHRNFTHTDVAADCVLDQTTLSALVLAVDRASGSDGTRVDLAALLATLATLAT